MRQILHHRGRQASRVRGIDRTSKFAYVEPVGRVEMARFDLTDFEFCDSAPAAEQAAGRSA